MDPIVLALILFTLSVLIGFEIITKVPPILHTPLVVASHAMAAIMVVSAIEVAGSSPDDPLAQILGGIALLLGVKRRSQNFVVFVKDFLILRLLTSQLRCFSVR